MNWVILIHLVALVMLRKKMYSFPLKNNVYILSRLLTQWKNYSIQGLFHNRI